MSSVDHWIAVGSVVLGVAAVWFLLRPPPHATRTGSSLRAVAGPAHPSASPGTRGVNALIVAIVLGFGPIALGSTSDRPERQQGTFAKDLGDEIVAFLFVALLLFGIAVGMVIWVVVNLGRRPRYTTKVVLLAVSAPLLLIPPMVWRQQAIDLEAYPARYAQYEVELAEYRAECADRFCLFEPEAPHHPTVDVPLYLLIMAIGVAALVQGVRMKPTDRFRERPRRSRAG